MKRMIAALCTLLSAALLGGCGGAPAPAPEAPGRSLTLWVISDVHYAPPSAYAYAGTFAAVNDESPTGKQMKYQEAILSAFLARAAEEKPDYLLITGDLAYNGARASHEALAAKLAPLGEAGVRVLVLPGNHDITPGAYVFPDGEPEAAESVTPEEFAAVYAECGFEGALSRDGASLSYAVDTGRGVRLFLLDSNLSYGQIFGKLRPETLAWLEGELEACRQAGDEPIVCAHHNLLSHHPAFDFGYRLGEPEKTEALLARYGARLFFSGHLHPQHAASDGTVTDVATGCFSVWPHRYGVLEWTPAEAVYESRTVDAAAYARETGSDDPFLLSYDSAGYAFFYDSALDQARSSLAGLDLSEADRKALAEKCAELNVKFFAGELSPADAGALDPWAGTGEDNAFLRYLRLALEGAGNSLFFTLEN